MSSTGLGVKEVVDMNRIMSTPSESNNISSESCENNEEEGDESKLQQQKSFFMSDERVRELFDNLDLSKNGKVSMEELAIAADKHLLGFCNTVEDYEVFMKTVDTQKNGYIEYEDFEKWVREKEEMIHNIYELFDLREAGL
jgi:Ca2+-binding EF-hand superfamily protein